MGPGILTRYSKQVFGTAVALLAIAVAIILYVHLRGPVGGVSPYEEVNDLYEQERISFTVEHETYPADVEVIQVTIRNDAEDTVVAPSLYQKDEWLLEMLAGGVWHTMRISPNVVKQIIKWKFPAEEYGPNSSPSGIVKWNGGEQRYLCNITEYYKSPLEAGTYRIVFPEMEHVNTSALAVEFEVR